MDTTFHPSNPSPCFSGVIAPEFVLSWIQQNPSPQGLRRRCGGRFGRRFFYLCKTLTHPHWLPQRQSSTLPRPSAKRCCCATSQTAWTSAAAMWRSAPKWSLPREPSSSQAPSCAARPPSAQAASSAPTPLSRTAPWTKTPPSTPARSTAATSAPTTTSAPSPMCASTPSPATVCIWALMSRRRTPTLPGATPSAT